MAAIVELWIVVLVQKILLLWHELLHLLAGLARVLSPLIDGRHLLLRLRLPLLRLKIWLLLMVMIVVADLSCGQASNRLLLAIRQVRRLIEGHLCI